MTIVISFRNHLIADRAASIDGFVFDTTKVHASTDILWGLAGFNPTRQMLRAQDLPQLVSALKANHIASKTTAILVIEKATQERWHVTLDEDQVYVEAVTMQGFPVGSYRVEWLNYANRHGHTQESAIRFCTLISRINGLDGYSITTL